MNRIPSLDGFRAISIVLVVFSHCRFLDGFPPNLYAFAKACDVGVNVFFVISGYLITTLLLKEYKRENTISFKNFFVKRAFRILPVFFLYLLFICIYNEFISLDISKSNFLHAITFTTNFDTDKNWFIGHFWTLAVEEQFYLFWPLVFLIFRKRIKPILLLLIAYSCLVRVIIYKFHFNPSLFLHPFFSVSDSILVGAFIAVLHFNQPEMFTGKVFKNYYLQALALILIVLFVYTSGHGKWGIVSLPFGNTIIAIAIIYLILSYINLQNNLVFKFLNHRIVTHIGVLSYSIYLWQEFFFGKEAMIFNEFPLNMLAIYFISLASYYLWEKPFLQIKERLIQKKLVPIQ